MAQSLPNVLTSMLRVIFLRGSPERVEYSVKLFIIMLFLAIGASAAVQTFVHRDPDLLIVIRVFAEMTMFMLGVVWLTRYIARFRLARCMLILVMISLLADLALILVSLPGLDEVTKIMTYVLGALAIYGAGNTLHWGLRRSIWIGLLCAGGYVGVVLVLDNTFRSLFAIMVAG